MKTKIYYADYEDGYVIFQKKNGKFACARDKAVKIKVKVRKSKKCFVGDTPDEAFDNYFASFGAPNPEEPVVAPKDTPPAPSVGASTD